MALWGGRQSLRGSVVWGVMATLSLRVPGLTYRLFDRSTNELLTHQDLRIPERYYETVVNRALADGGYEINGQLVYADCLRSCDQ